MKITMTYESDCLKAILKNNLIEQVRPILGLSEILDCIASHPEMLKDKPSSCIYTGNNNVRIVLELDFRDDICNVYVNDIIILDNATFKLNVI